MIRAPRLSDEQFTEFLAVREHAKDEGFRIVDTFDDCTARFLVFRAGGRHEPSYQTDSIDALRDWLGSHGR